MKGFAAFFSKEIRELLRTKRLAILLCLFTLFGIMNPAVALLTPKLIDMMSEELAASGMKIEAVTVTALDAWSQFAKNIPMALIVLLSIQLLPLLTRWV